MIAGNFVELLEPVAYMQAGREFKLGMLPAGRLGVIQDSIPEGGDSVLVATVGERGSQCTLRVPLGSMRVLGGCQDNNDAAPTKTDGTSSLFVGEVTGEECRVMVVPMDERGRATGVPFDLPNQGVYSSVGFGWGHGGDGPMELSLALLRQSVEDLAIPQDERSELVRAWHRRFCADFVGELDRSDRWSITSTGLLQRLNRLIAGGLLTNR